MANLNSINLDKSTYQQIYLEFIRSCYRSFPEAAPYYEQLIDHLNQRPGSALQQVQMTEFEAPADSSNYPVLLPWHTVEHGEEQRRPRVVILQGYPSPECISYLGANFSIRPEFFIGHLLCSVPGSSRMPFDLPNLPSSQESLIRISFCIVVLPLDPISQSRSDVESALLGSDKILKEEGRYGASRFRKVNIHDDRTYSLEESMAFTIVQHDKHEPKWSAIILTDHGRSPTYQQGLPSSTYDQSGRPGMTLPIIPYDMPAASSRGSSVDSQSTRNFELFDQFHPLKKIALRDEIDFQLAGQDPFFLLASIMRTSFLSWSQALNILANTVAKCHDKLTLPQQQLHYYLEQLRYCVVMINHIKEVLLENAEVIKKGGHHKWPKASMIETQTRKLYLQEQLSADHGRLLARCDHLLVECESTTTTLLGFAQLMASERSISQAIEVQRLTTMAAIFIPMTFATGIFGMNITEFEPAPRWWWPVGVACSFVLMTSIWLSHRDWRNFVRCVWQEQFLRLWREMRGVPSW